MAESPAPILPSSVYTSPEDIPVRDVARLMTARGIGSIVVVGQDQKPVGIVTDRDVMVRVTAQGLDPAVVPVGAVMSQPLVTITDQEALETGIAAMNCHGIRRLPIVDGEGCLVSILTMDDIIRHNLANGADLSGIVRDRSIRLEPDPEAHPRPGPEPVPEPEIATESAPALPPAPPLAQAPPPAPAPRPSRLESGLDFKPGVTAEDFGKPRHGLGTLGKPAVIVPMVKRTRSGSLVNDAKQWIFGKSR